MAEHVPQYHHPHPHPRRSQHHHSQVFTRLSFFLKLVHIIRKLKAHMRSLEQTWNSVSGTESRFRKEASLSCQAHLNFRFRFLYKIIDFWRDKSLEPFRVNSCKAIVISQKLIRQREVAISRVSVYIVMSIVSCHAIRVIRTFKTGFCRILLSLKHETYYNIAGCAKCLGNGCKRQRGGKKDEMTIN